MDGVESTDEVNRTSSAWRLSTSWYRYSGVWLVGRSVFRNCGLMR